MAGPPDILWHEEGLSECACVCVTAGVCLCVCVTQKEQLKRATAATNDYFYDPQGICRNLDAKLNTF